jgi:hypothetical protein
LMRLGDRTALDDEQMATDDTTCSQSHSETTAGRSRAGSRQADR